MRTTRSTQALFVLAIALIIVVALWPAATEVETAEVTRGTMRVTVDEDGVTRVRERFVVAAPVSGRLERIAWNAGDPVQRGTVIARLLAVDAPLTDARLRAEWQAAVRSAAAARDQAVAERNRAEMTGDRLQLVLQQQIKLAAAGAVPSDAVDAARTAAAAADAAYQAAAAAVDRTSHELELARVRLQTPASPGRVVSVVAPCDGVILRKLRESESVVAAGEPLIEMGDSHALEIVADLLSADAVKVTVGAPVLVESWGGENVLQGTVTRIEPAGFMKVSALGVEEQRVNVVVSLPDSPRSPLGDGYRATVRIVVWSADDVVKTPIGSVFRLGNDWAVFVADRGRARIRDIEIGHRNDTEVEIVHGLAPHDRVILHPPDSLTDGKRLRMKSAP